MQINDLGENCHESNVPVRFIGECYADKDCSFGGNNVVHMGAKLYKTKMGRFTYIGSATKIHWAEIGSFCSIGAEVLIGLGRHPTSNFISTYPAFFATHNSGCLTSFVSQQLYEESLPIKIGHDVWIGNRAMICDGVKIGDGAIIAAGAVVADDVEPYAIVGGVPAKLIRMRYEREQIEKILSFKWWAKDINWIHSHADLFANEKEFFAEINNSLGDAQVEQTKFAQPAISPITIATSIAPRDIKLQQQTIASWKKLGFNVISVNIQDEITALSSDFPDVNFVVTRRDGRTKYGKPYVFFDDIVQHLNETSSKVVGIVNADIHLLTPGFYEFIEHQATGALVYGSRVDITDLNDLAGDFLPYGFDYFFFDKEIIKKYPQSELMIGLSWWDYWVPFVAVVKAVPVKKLMSRVAFHIKHKNANSDLPWVEIGLTLAKYIKTPFEIENATIGKLQHFMYEIIENGSKKITMSSQI